MALSRSEAGKLGAEKSRQIIADKMQSRIDSYNLNPKLCLECSKPMEYDKRRNKYCDHSCAASYTNRGVSRSDKPDKKCVCGKTIKWRKNTYCSTDCRKIKRGELFSAGLISSRSSLRPFVIQRDGNKCSICSITTWQNQPVPLVLDHIDGHAENNLPDNLRMVCGNCDMQLPTYKSKNIGNGRAYRRERYAQGKSF